MPPGTPAATRWIMTPAAALSSGNPSHVGATLDIPRPPTTMSLASTSGYEWQIAAPTQSG